MSSILAASVVPILLVLRLSLVALLLAVAGCDTGGKPPTPPPPAPPEPTAEERFQRFVDALRRWVESDDRPGAVGPANVTPGTPVTSSRSKVEYRLIKPDSESTPFRAEVAIRTKSSVSIVLPKSDEEDSDEDSSAKRDAAANEEAIELPAELRSLQSASVAEIDRLRNSPMVEREKERVRRYQLEHREGRWRLLTDIDPDEEPFNAGALEYALGQQ